MALDSPGPLPPPPPEAYAPAPLLRGQLVQGWRTVLGVGWLGVVLGFAAVWRTSWTVGLSTWWLGPESSPRSPFLLIAPFVLPVVVIAAVVRHVRYTSMIGVVAALVAGGVGLGDLDRSPGLAAVELALAGGGMLISIASLAGLQRAAVGSAAGN